MATVTLYFEPFPQAGAVSLRIEESADGQAGWVEIENVTSIGTHPDYIDNYQTANATDIEYWFRIRWETGAGFSAYSDPVQGSAAPARFTTPSGYKAYSRLPAVASMSTVVLQTLIDRAYFMLQSDCGPFEVSGECVERMRLGMHVLLDRLVVATDPAALAAVQGVISEKKGSYEYRRDARVVLELLQWGQRVPEEVRDLVCPCGIGDQEGETEMITTQVFGPTPWVGVADDVDELRVVTATERHTYGPTPQRRWTPD